MKIVAILMVSLTYLAICRSEVNDNANETSIKEGPKMVSKTTMDREVKNQNNRTETPLVEETEPDYNDNQTETLMNEETNKTCVPRVRLDAICMKLDTSIDENLAPNEVGMKERKAMIRFYGGPNINETEKRSLNESIFFSENGNQSLICIVPPKGFRMLYIPPHFKCEACEPYTFAEMFGIGVLTGLVILGVLAILNCIVKNCGDDLSKQPKHQALISGDARNAPTKMH